MLPFLSAICSRCATAGLRFSGEWEMVWRRVAAHAAVPQAKFAYFADKTMPCGNEWQASIVRDAAMT